MRQCTCPHLNPLPLHPRPSSILHIPNQLLFAIQSSSTYNMATHSESFVFESIFQCALQEYEIQTGINLIRHPLAIQLEHCNSVESITDVIEQQAQAFREFRGGNNKIITLLKHAVQVLHKLSAPASLSEHIGLVRPKGP